MKKFTAILSKIVRVRITLTAGDKVRNIHFGKTTARWTLIKAAVTILTFGIIVNVAV